MVAQRVGTGIEINQGASTSNKRTPAAKSSTNYSRAVDQEPDSFGKTSSADNKESIFSSLPKQYTGLRYQGQVASLPPAPIRSKAAIELAKMSGGIYNSSDILTTGYEEGSSMRIATDSANETLFGLGTDSSRLESTIRNAQDQLSTSDGTEIGGGDAIDPSMIQEAALTVRDEIAVEMAGIIDQLRAKPPTISQGQADAEMRKIATTAGQRLENRIKEKTEIAYHNRLAQKNDKETAKIFNSQSGNSNPINQNDMKEMASIERGELKGTRQDPDRKEKVFRTEDGVNVIG